MFGALWTRLRPWLLAAGNGMHAAPSNMTTSLLPFATALRYVCAMWARSRRPQTGPSLDFKTTGTGCGFSSSLAAAKGGRTPSSSSEMDRTPLSLSAMPPAVPAIWRAASRRTARRSFLAAKMACLPPMICADANLALSLATPAMSWRSPHRPIAVIWFRVPAIRRCDCGICELTSYSLPCLTPRMANGRYGHRRAITPPHLTAVNYSVGKSTADQNATRITSRRNDYAPDFTALILLHGRSWSVQRKRPRRALPARAWVWRNCSALYRLDGETARH